MLVTPELVAPLEKREVTEAPGDRVYQPNDPEFYLLGRIEGKLGREFRATKGEQDPLKLMKHFKASNTGSSDRMDTPIEPRVFCPQYHRKPPRREWIEE